MHLLRRIIVVSTAVVAIGCRDTSTPLLATNYLLITVDGRSLPTFISPVPEGPTVLSGTFLLDGGSHATASEQRRDMSGNEYTFNATYRYTITGNVIQFDFDPHCGGPAIDCASPPRGTISGDDLLIDYSGGNNSPIYDYRHMRMIDLPPG
ncbi:MAG TPA: hypothetical protein VFP26_03170 [Gemmatimonadaceae bacterium]|jgi:hypothetical protein|nr:hypothetical protein [Gemmatimonadaceae bacterium]